MRRLIGVVLAVVVGGCSYLPSMSGLVPHIPWSDWSWPDISMPDIGVPHIVTAAARLPLALLPGGKGETVSVDVTGADGEVSPIPMRVCRPDGDGPFPLAVINHGAPPAGKTRASLRLPDCDSPPAVFFRDHDYIVAMPLRRGYGAGDTGWAQNPGSCAKPDYTASAIEGARDIAAAVTAAVALPNVKPDGIVVVGEDEGGWATLGYAFRPNAAVAAVVVMGGGEGGRAANMDRRTCRPDLLIASARQLGALSRTRMLWIYAKNDPVYSPDLAAALRDAYDANGAQADLTITDDVAGDAHALLFTDNGAAVWGPLVAQFLTP